MITLKSDREIELMRIAGHITELAHQAIEKAIRPGVSTYELDKILEELNIRLDTALNLEMDDNRLISRIMNRRLCSSCGRGYNLLTLKCGLSLNSSAAISTC